jgi:hypothetical protein
MSIVTAHHCFRCGRPLTNHASVRRGIGPICHARAEWEAELEDAQRLKNLECHHGFVCYNPQHASVTLGRFGRRFNAL